jgi:large subunit ribosomal protein L30
MAKVKVTLVKSLIDRPANQRRTVEALGLRKLNSSRVHETTPQVMGMVNQVQHLLLIEELN